MSTHSPAIENGDHGDNTPQAAMTSLDLDGGDIETPRTDLPPPLLPLPHDRGGDATAVVVADAAATDSSSSPAIADHATDYFSFTVAPSSTTTTELDSTTTTSNATLPPKAHDSSSRPYVPAAQPAATVSSRSGTTDASDALASGHVEPHAPVSTTQRPLPHTTVSNISVGSVTSAATVTQEGEIHDKKQPIRFPNQALSALHTQQHPPYYVPRRGAAALPGTQNIASFTSAIASLHSSGVRTAHNTPAVTPSQGLFTPGPPSVPVTESSEGSGPPTYASPYLHFTHTHIPKETHVADVDVDPISGRKLINHYEIIDELGRGTHGKVKLGRDLTSSNSHPTYVAIKIVERFSKKRKLGRLGTTEDKVKMEVAILKKARHPNVVALLEVIDDPTRKKVYIVLEWVERGEINWRVKGPKEIGMIEARRYEREKSEHQSERAMAEDAAVFAEAQRRLARQKRRQITEYRLKKRGIADMPEAWSNEMAGDNESEESEEDRLSRISSSLTSHSEARRPSIDLLAQLSSPAASPMHAVESGEGEHLMTLTSDSDQGSSNDADPLSRRPSSAISMTGLEGTMYGAYDHMGQTSRVASSNSLTSSRGHGERLSRLAMEILDSHLDSELEYVPVMTMDQIRVAFRDTLLGLQYLHYQGIVHRDIKPPNLLATIDNRVKISDFGVSYLGRPITEGEVGEDVSETEAQDLDDEAKELAKTVGTPAFYAPELCIIDPPEETLPVTKAIDVWALGVTLFCMLFARTPFVDSEYVVMRQIADEDIHIPRKRLQPVDNRPKSRPPSHTRGYSSIAAGRRHELDLVYEDIEDTLHDLLRRLLTKDPRRRITLEEVRHHPWVLSDLPNKVQWIEETDPSRQAEGKKIEVSKEEVNTAVVPLNLVERMRSGLSGLKKVLEKTGITRPRGTSSAGRDGSSAPSAASSSSTLSQDGRRRSLRGDEAIFTALKASRDNTLLSAPAHVDMQSQGDDAATRPGGFGSTLTRVSSRPLAPHRANTVASTAGSLRTVKQSDFQPRSVTESPPPSPGLPGTPRELAIPGGSTTGGLLGGTSRLIQTVRERSSQRFRLNKYSEGHARSADSTDAHSEASVAVSETNAAGHVQTPTHLLRETPNVSSRNSPASSRPRSVSSAHQNGHLSPATNEPGLLTRMSSSSSLASLGRSLSRSLRRSIKPHESSAEDWERADEERIRRLVRESKNAAENSGRSSPRNFIGSPTPIECSASPDDFRQPRGNCRSDSRAGISSLDTPEEDSSPIDQAGHLPSDLVSSTSDFGSAVSMSMSNPSVPSAFSKASSFDPYEGRHHLNGETFKSDISSGDTLNPSRHQSPVHEDDGEDASRREEAVFAESGQDDDYYSSDSDGGLIMRGKTARKQSGHGLVLGGGTSLSIRSKKSSRSGSNNTMKKIRTRDSIDDTRSHDISEE